MFADKCVYFSRKMPVVDTDQKCLCEALPMSTRNIYFHGEIKRED